MDNVSSPSEKTFEFSQAERLKGFSDTVWSEFSPLAAKYKAINLGQGFPDWVPIDCALTSLSTLSQPSKSPEVSLLHQYTHSSGLPSLLEKLSNVYSPLFSRFIDPSSNLLVTNGATESLLCACQAFLDPSDEAIAFQPHFDIYPLGVQLSGATCRFVSLHSNSSPTSISTPSFPSPSPSELPKISAPIPSLSSADFQFDKEEFKRAVNPRTKLIFLNNPHNPTGKVFSLSELEFIASVVRQNPRVIVISDEVYEFIIYDTNQHVRFANLEGMWQRTVTISSAAKTFSMTGWKIGWAIAPYPLISSMLRVHEIASFCVSTPLQHSVISALEEIESGEYISTLKNNYQIKRNLLISALKKIGLNPFVPQGTFFVMVDISDVKIPQNYKQDTITGKNMDAEDWKVARWMTKELKVTPIPCSAFYTENPSYKYIRFAFCKTEEGLNLAIERLKSWNK